MRASCKICHFYKKSGFCEWTRREVKRYIDIKKYSCIGYVNKKDKNIRGILYE